MIEVYTCVASAVSSFSYTCVASAVSSFSNNIMVLFWYVLVFKLIQFIIKRNTIQNGLQNLNILSKKPNGITKIPKNCILSQNAN